MQKERANKPRRMSLALKLNLVTIGVILVLAAGLITIFFTSYMQKINQIYTDTVERSLFQTMEEINSKLTLTLGDESISHLANLSTLVTDKDFRETARRAAAENNDELAWEWLKSKPSQLLRYDQDLFDSSAEAIRNGNSDILPYSSREEALINISMAGEYLDLTSLLANVQALNGLDRLAVLVREGDSLYLLTEYRKDSGGKITLSGWDQIGRLENLPAEKDGAPASLYPPAFVHQGDNVVIQAYLPYLVRTGGEEPEHLCTILTEINMNTVLKEYNHFLLQNIAFVVGLILLVLFVNIFLTRRLATKPLRLLARETRQFGKGEHGYTRDGVISLPIRSKDEIGDLYRDIGDMQTRIVDYVDDLARITSERERIQTELQLASSIQSAMLPSTFPAFPDRMDFDLHASMVPAKDVGGDFYGFFLTDPNHLALLIADVSGKGIPAALFMMASVITISDRAMAGGTPAEILTAANTAIHKQNSTHMFVTAWLGILDLRTGTMTCANAGHEYPMVRHNGVFSLLKDPHGLVIGGFAQAKYRNYEIQLAPGDAVYVYTDGVAEASDPSEAFYCTERLLNTLNANAAGTPKEILAAVSEDVKAFAAGAEQFDDITMLCVEYKGPVPGTPS